MDEWEPLSEDGVRTLKTEWKGGPFVAGLVIVHGMPLAESGYQLLSKVSSECPGFWFAARVAWSIKHNRWLRQRHEYVVVHPESMLKQPIDGWMWIKKVEPDQT